MKRDVFQALADPTRRAIVALIAFQAMTPGALAAHFDISRQAVSKHIQILTDSAVLGAEHRGREIYYHLQSDALRTVEDWLAPFKKLWEARFDQLDEVLRENQ
jgi:DNA-binding transcriptional ArsR family regulator